MNYLCGTTLVLPVGQHSYARYRADPAQSTYGKPMFDALLGGDIKTCLLTALHLPAAL